MRSELNIFKMDIIRRTWNKVTHTKALEQSSGYYETQFFGSVYRVIYLAGKLY